MEISRSLCDIDHRLIYLEKETSQLYTIIDQTSNNIENRLIYTSNAFHDLVYHIDYQFSLSSNNFNLYMVNSSNQLHNRLYDVIKNELSYDIMMTSNMLMDTSNQLQYISNKFNNDLLENIYNDIADVINLSNYINITSNKLTNKITSLTTDDIIAGNENRFIVNDKYDRNIIFTETVSTPTIVTKSVINFGGIDIYNNLYNTPSINIQQDNDVDAVNIYVKNVPSFVITKRGYVGVNTSDPEFDMDVNGVLNSRRFSGDGGLLRNVNLSDKTSDDILEGTCNMYFREERLNEMIMSKSIDMFQPGSNMSIIRNGIYYGSLLIAGQLTVNSLKVLDVNAAYISSNASNYGNGIFDDEYSGKGISLQIISNLENDIKNISNILNNTINNLNSIYISSLDQVGNGTSNKYITNDIYNSSLNVYGRMQAEYVGGDGMFITNINLLDKTTDDLREGSKYYFTDERFSNYIQHISADFIKSGLHNQYIVNGIYDGDLIITGDLTVSRVQILDIFANALNSNYESDYYNSSNSYVQSLASFIRNVNANLMNDMKIFDNKLNLIMTCNMDETILGIIANDSNLLLRKFSETIDYVNSNVDIISIDTNRNISNLINYVNDNVSKIEYYNYYSLEGSNIDYVMSILNTSNQIFEDYINKKILSLSTNNVKEGVNLYYTPKRVGAITYASNIHVSNYVKECFDYINIKLENSNINAINDIHYNVNILDEKISNYNYNISNYFYSNVDFLHKKIIEYTVATSNYVDYNTELLNNRVTTLSLDEIAMGCNNTYIKNNIYDGYLIVTGGIITNNIIISDIDDTVLMSTSNFKNLTSSSSVNNSSNSYLQNLINKINIQSDIIQSNNYNINMLSSNLDFALNRIHFLETINLMQQNNISNLYSIIANITSKIDFMENM
jgi:hypothetical protein